jgi:hypothetical protein
METVMTTAHNFPHLLRGPATASVLASIRDARRRGLSVGRRVRLGNVDGVVIGYNIARNGPYPGARFPLLVRTELGTGKFAPDEVSAC